MQRYSCLIFLFFICPIALFAQSADITGLWKGTLYNDTTKQFYKYEIGISKEKDKYTGFSHTWFLLDDKQYFGVKKVKVKIAVDGKIIVEDDGLISNNYPVVPSKNVRQLNVLTLNADDSVMVLDGPFTTNRTKEYSPLTGHITLQRKNDFWQSALVPHLQELGKENEMSFVKEEYDEIIAKQKQASQIESGKAATAKLTADQDAAATANAKKEAEAMANKKEGEVIAASQNIAKLEKAAAVKKQEEEKIAVAAEQARELAAKKEMIKKEQEEARLTKQLVDAKTALEKEKAKELLAAQQKEILEQSKKDKELKALAIKEAEVRKTSEKQAEKEALVKKQAEQKADAEAKLLADKMAASENLAKKQAFEKAASEKRIAEIAAAQKTAELEKEKKRLESLIPVAPAAKVNERTTVLQQTVTFSSDSLQLSLYDNGEVDGDTVSVLLNGQLILAKQGLTTTAIKKTIYIPAGTDRIELVMYAETLGSIPPNTGLLVVRDGKSLYEVRFSGDLQKNASIVFNRKKE